MSAIPSSSRINWTSRGFSTLAPGEACAFPNAWTLAHWLPGSFAVVDPGIVYLPMLLAKNPRQGAFTALVREIDQVGLLPVVVDPLDFLRAILTRWKWTARRSRFPGFDCALMWPRDHLVGPPGQLPPNEDAA